MTDDEFTDAMRSAELFAALLDADSNDFGMARRSLDYADMLGPIVDPTSWKRTLADREAMKRWLAVLESARAAAREFIATARTILDQRVRIGGGCLVPVEGGRCVYRPGHDGAHVPDPIDPRTP